MAAGIVPVVDMNLLKGMSMFTRENSHMPISLTIAHFMHKVYAWMMLGLMVTAAAAVATVSTPALFSFIFGNKIVFYGMLFGQLGLVVALSAMIKRLSPWAARLMFLTYATTLGMILSSLFLVFQMHSILVVFATTCAMFGVMAVYGYTTKADLTNFGSILMMGLIGMIIASLINMFVGSDQMSYIISFIGVIIFTGLIAFDMQRIKQIAMQLEAQPHYGISSTDMSQVRATESNIALLCALTLYMDFVNLFLHLLELMGQRRRN